MNWIAVKMDFLQTTFGVNMGFGIWKDAYYVMYVCLCKGWRWVRIDGQGHRLSDKGLNEGYI